MKQQPTRAAIEQVTGGWQRCGAQVAVFSLLVWLSACGLFAQQRIGQPFPGGQNYPGGQMQDPIASMGGNPIHHQMELKRLDALNADRQKSLVADTNRLLKLTADLNAQINGTHPASLTGEQLRMVAEIEKLAHNIREKMCTSVNGNPRLGPGPPMIAPNPIP